MIDFTQYQSPLTRHIQSDEVTARLERMRREYGDEITEAEGIRILERTVKGIEMSEVKHTPGPWKVFNGVDIFPDDDDTKATKHIAHCAPDDRPQCVLTTEERRSNANLIAAAPDLLAALEWYVKNDDTYMGDPENQFWIDGFEAAKAAITKAKGEA